MISSILETFRHHAFFFTWRDALEILFFSSAIYYFSRWLKKDRQKNLLFYFYAYCLLVFCTYNLSLTTLHYALILFSPMLFMIFVLIHQNTLQKNFITLRNLIAAPKSNHDWLETLIQAALININNNKEIICVVEHTDTLQDHLTTPLALHAEIKKELLDIIIASQSFDHAHMVWLNTQGTLLGINARWKISAEFYIDETLQHSWKDEALFFTTKTDALVFKTDAAARSFDIIHQGKMFEKVSADKTLAYLKKYMGTMQDSQKGVIHGTTTIKERVQQPNA